MKRIYIQPETLILLPYGQVVMEATSGAPRQIGGGPNDEGMPGSVGETDGETDPYGDDEGGHGQGSGGGGNRSKSGMIWDEW